MRTEVARRRAAGVPDDQLGSIENGQGQLDELFVPVDGVQRAANVVGDFGAALLLNPVRKPRDG